MVVNKNITKHAGAELGQAQLKLGLDFDWYLYIFGFAIFEFVGIGWLDFVFLA